MKSDAAKLAAQLRQDGFDKSTTLDGSYARVGCSQCEALVINGTACHEHGCPNKKD